MSAFSKPNAAPVASRDDLVAYLESGSRSRDEWRIGTEHEKFPFRIADGSTLSYDEPGGIRDILKGMEQFGWTPVREGDNVIAMTREDGASISLEPAGQLELSGAQLETLHQTCVEVTTHRRHIKQVAEANGVGLIGLGFHPTARRDQMHWMPKGRYRIMRDYMPKVGTMGLDMMLRTCTVQVNLDHGSEADMVQKMRVSMALQPVATALFANSPFTEGKPNGFKSYRAHVWTDTDNARSGNLDLVFEDGFGFERYADYLLDVPMYFVYRDGGYIDASGQSFRDFMAGRLPAYPGQTPTMGDWADHMSTAFPDVRLKKYLEMRGADGGPWDRLCALPALWTGLLYDQTALDAAWDLVKDWTAEDRHRLVADVPRLALQATIGGRSVQEVAKQVLEIAHDGLARRARLNSAGDNETGFLTPLREIADSGMTAADRLLEAYDQKWKGDISRIFQDYGY
ncbi:glutamate--cysteine ligase [Novispirillum itersonii]|uniref:Glutamate--cysteine ligase n=1 Tax=Novispirillum itersonii TaxID=189 RepID=A0A7X0DMU4_NOVIT|nr:glutamate--cysteine ligase [Novispirillum itersonii]MBB6211458.1 glutamate--cysteine ligase [Novispirillum itersonii]